MTRPVLEIYRITLLSNFDGYGSETIIVLEIYRITLLSNVLICSFYNTISFRDLQNYTTLKPKDMCDNIDDCFRDLQNYTTLKHSEANAQGALGFRDLQNYTTLKHSNAYCVTVAQF